MAPQILPSRTSEGDISRAPHVAPVTIEHHRDPLGVGEAAPRLSWRTAAGPAWRQEAYQLSIERSGRIETSAWSPGTDSVLVPWPGEPLTSREQAVVRVRVRGADGSTSPWSAPTRLEAGLLEPGDWRAVAIAPSPGAGDGGAWWLRHEFDVVRRPVRARLYVTAHGLVAPELNASPVGDHELTPGWTVYPRRLVYDVHDVTDLVTVGRNALGVWLADGWYRGLVGFDGGTRRIYGDRVAALCQLELHHADGTIETIATSAQGWTASPSPVTATGLYEGESFDARRHATGWSAPGFDDVGWSPVTGVVERDPATLVAREAPPVRCTEELHPVSVTRVDSTTHLLDFGQNLVGRLRLRVSGERGLTLRLRHAEVLHEGRLYTRPLRAAVSIDEYTLAGDGVEEWEPRFTVHGFRYAEVTGWPGEPAGDDVVARVLHTDMRRTGWFACSDPLVERLHENVRWSMRGNFVHLPTDCPQRDERLGWTGDLQVFAPTASFLYDCSALVRSWLRDVALEQLPDGTVPWFVPVVPGGPIWTPPRPAAVWGDAAVLAPWTLYERFADAGVLAEQYDSARAWVDLVARLAGPDRVWDEGFQLGDWLDPAAPPDDPARALTDPHLVATAYFARSAARLAATAAVLGRTEDAERYGRLADEVRRAFLARYTEPDGRLTSDTQTAHALAICFELLDPAAEAAAGERLAELVRAGGARIGTGFAGTPVVSEALTRTGQSEAAYELLLERECPSWLYTVLQGGTTIWERWDSLLPDGAVNPGDMTSFNHYALGAVADWLHRCVAGIDPIEPGYRRVRFRPFPGGGLTWARARHDSPYGTVASSWRLLDGVPTLEVVLPTGCTGEVVLPGGAVHEVGPGRHVFTTPWPATGG